MSLERSRGRREPCEGSVMLGSHDAIPFDAASST
jgi:hypothetical protein